MKNIFTNILIFFLILIIWELSVFFGTSNLVSAPTDIYVVGKEWFASSFFSDVSITLGRVIAGFIIGTIVGVVVGILTSLSKKVDRCGSLYLHFLRSIAPVALAPFFVLLLGIGELSKIVLIAWACFFPVWLGTHNGISNVEKKYIDAAKLLKIKKSHLLHKIYLPAALPHVLTGVRLSMSLAFILVFIGEGLGADSGVGYKISVAYDVFRSDIMLMGLIVLGLLGLFGDYIIRLLSKKLFPWLQN